VEAWFLLIHADARCLYLTSLWFPHLTSHHSRSPSLGPPPPYVTPPPAVTHTANLDQPANALFLLISPTPQTLSKALALHLDNRVLVYDNKTIVFEP